jgi:hypothetical protein
MQIFVSRSVVGMLGLNTDSVPSVVSGNTTEHGKDADTFSEEGQGPNRVGSDMSDVGGSSKSELSDDRSGSCVSRTTLVEGHSNHDTLRQRSAAIAAPSHLN